MSNPRERLSQDQIGPQADAVHLAQAGASKRLPRAARDTGAGGVVTPRDAALLQRAIGNRSVSALVLHRQPALATQSPASATKFLRINIVGHASARWRSAGSSAAKADARNEKLALERADAVKQVVAERLSELNLPVPVEFDVSTADDEHEAVTVGSYGEGSRAALERTRGDRTSDEEYDRRVDVEAELVTTAQRSKTVKLPPKRMSAKTRDWMLTITGFREFAVGAAVVELDLEIKNPITSRIAKGSAVLGGGGVNVGIPWKKTSLSPRSSAIGEADIKFKTDHAVGFGNFDDTWLRMGRLGLLIRKTLYLRFLDLSKDPISIQRGWTLSPKLASYLVSGKLHLHNVPSDTYYVDAGTTSVPYKHKSGWGESVQVMFKTESARIAPSDRQRVEQFVDTWARRLH